MSQQIDYNKLFFPVKEVTKIVCQPTSNTLAELVKELTKNAVSVTSTLGEVRHGHLFLVLSPNEFNAIPGTQPVIRPDHSGTLVILPNSIAA